MGRYTLGRLAGMVPTLLLITLGAFFLTTAARGDPAEAAVAAIKRFAVVSGRPSIFLGGINFPDVYGEPVAIEAADEFSFRVIGMFTWANQLFLSLGEVEPEPALPAD